MARSSWLRAVASLACVASFMAGCGSSGPELVFGPPSSTNAAPTLSIFAPSANLNLNQGERFTIEWTDADPDSAARILFVLQNIETGFEVLLVSNIEENDSAAPDEFSVSTSLVPLGRYYVRGEISDGVNAPVTSYALVEGSSARVVVQIGERGVNPLNVPPQVVVVAPSFNQGVAQDDPLTIVVRPSLAPINSNGPYDPDSNSTLYILLDLDDDPQNDNPAIPDEDEIIVLRTDQVAQGEFDQLSFDISIDLAQIPARPNGLPYYIRATIVDDSNAPVHDYADGTIHIVRSATGTVDLAKVGTETAGARLQGFNPGSWLGTRMTTISDFDADGIDDFVLVARYGNPRNFGNIGEAYLIYGLDRQRFGGSINVNSVSTSVSGVIFEAPPNRMAQLRTDASVRPRGITDVSWVPDLSGDGRPEILFGLGLVDGIFQGRDDDPGDDPGERAVNISIRQDLVQRRFNGELDAELDDDFQSTIDTYVDRQLPTQSFGDSTVLRIGATVTPDETNPGDQFTLISYPAIVILGLFSTRDTDNISELEVTLELHGATGTIPPGDTFSVHQLTQNISENVRYTDFNGDGVPGPTEENEYEADELDATINFLDGTVRVDVTDTIQALLDGELGVNPGWIVRPILPITGTFVSSEGPDDLRPTLIITYSEALEGEVFNYGCYPDSLPNNISNIPDDPDDGFDNPPLDSSFEANGVAIYFNSENRDREGFVNPDRLEATQVALELVGQEDPTVGLSPSYGFLGGTSVGGGNIDHYAGAERSPAGSGLLNGGRLQSGWYDFINDGAFGEAPPRSDYWGETFRSLPDMDNDDRPELIISAPRLELYVQSLFEDTTAAAGRHLSSTFEEASILVFPSSDYGTEPIANDGDGNQTLPRHAQRGQGNCASDPPVQRSGPFGIRGGFAIRAENIEDYLGGANPAGDVNLDSVPDIVCGAPQNDYLGQVDTGAFYLIYGRRPVGDVSLNLLDDPGLRPPTLRVRGETAGDRIGTIQVSGQDINGDRIDDVFFASPDTDFGGVRNDFCGDYDQNGIIDGNDLNVSLFNACRSANGEEVFVDDTCKAYDFDNDRDIDQADRDVFDCLLGGFGDCCPVNNGFIGIIFGNIQLDGDRTISQLATSDLRGVIFYGANAGDRAGTDIASVGDFNRDGFGDLLISAPGVRFTDANNRDRVGVAYLIFGGTHLNGNRVFSLDQVGTSSLPGMIFWSPFFAGRPNEAPIEYVGDLGDINNDGFDDIALGLPRADFLDQTLPQNPNDPGTNPNIGRRRDDGNVYIIYGNNTAQ